MKTGAFGEDLKDAWQERRDAEPLSYVELTAPLEARKWLVHERIPMANVTLLSGEGAIGKSLLLMQLSGAVVLGKDWIGTLPEQGPVLYLSCEEDDGEVRRRMEDVAQHFGSSRQAMADCGLRFLSFAGKDAILGQPDRSGIIRPTPLLEQVRCAALQLRPKLIVFDPAADVYGGNEIQRGQVRQFITLGRGLAIAADSAVLVAGHPSLTGIATDTGLSGSTGWHNSVRARLYLKPAPGEDKALRVLEWKKSNYGPINETIVLRWRDGVYVVEPGAGTFEQLAAEAEIDHLFIKILRRFTEQGRNVSDKVSPSYAPSVFASEPEAKKAKAGKTALAEAMARLFASGRLRLVTEGPASRVRSRIVEAISSNDPSNGLPTPSNGLSTHTPHTPQPVGSGQEGVGSPARSNGRPAGEAASETESVASVPFMLTKELKRRLRVCGYSDEAISHMTPQDAHAILAQAGWSVT